jgi:FkbH-like protein
LLLDSFYRANVRGGICHRCLSMTVYSDAAVQPAQRSLKIAIAANFLATPVRASLALWLEHLNISSAPDFAPYDSIMQQLLDEDSAISHVDVAVILIRVENWCRRGQEISSAMARQNINIFLRSVESATKRQPRTVFIIINCPPSPAIMLDDALLAADEELTAALGALPSIDFVGAGGLNHYYPVADYHSYFISGTTGEQETIYSELCYMTLGTMIARRLSAVFAEPRKVIAVDCDNTLWRGICGEQGPVGVTIEAGHRLLQRTLLEHCEQGRLLCICSKNNEADVLAVFERNPGMLIEREHLSAIRANWNPKVDNLRSLSAELGLSLDAFIFIDDDPFECESVMALCPEVRTIRMDCAEDAVVAATLRQVWDFDRTAVTSEDRHRISYYRQEAERTRVRTAALSLQEFLETLDLEVVISDLKPDGIGRAVQLTQRVNQFNLNGIRRSTAELHARLGAATCLMVSASDRFGDYGVIGLLVYSRSEHALRVETAALSCRALGRGVEHRVAAHLAEAAQVSGRSYVEFEFLPTTKNAPMQAFLADIGAKDDATGRRAVLVEDLTRVLNAEGRLGLRG